MKELKKYSLLLLVFTFTLNAYSQVLNLHILDKKGDAIPFAHIENTRTNKYIVSNENGLAKLDTSFAVSGDSLLVSCMGFYVLSYKINYLDSDYKIIMCEIAYTLSEVIKYNYKNYGKFRITGKTHAFNIFLSGSILAIPVQLNSDSAEIEFIKLFTHTKCDSIVFRVSVLDTLDYIQHTQVAVKRVVTGKNIELKNLDLYSIAQDGIFYIIIEIFPSCQEVFLLNGYFTPGSNGTDCYMRGNLDDKEAQYSTLWLYEPNWVPRIYIEYKY